MHEKELELLARQLAEGLRGDHDALGREVVRLLACGHPVTPGRLASALQMTAEQVAGVLAGLADLEVDQGGNILGWGLTLIPTPHRFRVNGQQFYTWCALDALTYPALLQVVASVESSMNRTLNSFRKKLAKLRPDLLPALPKLLPPPTRGGS